MEKDPKGSTRVLLLKTANSCYVEVLPRGLSGGTVQSSSMAEISSLLTFLLDEQCGFRMGLCMLLSGVHTLGVSDWMAHWSEFCSPIWGTWWVDVVHFFLASCLFNPFELIRIVPAAWVWNRGMISRFSWSPHLSSGQQAILGTTLGRLGVWRFSLFCSFSTHRYSACTKGGMCCISGPKPTLFGKRTILFPGEKTVKEENPNTNLPGGLGYWLQDWPRTFLQRHCAVAGNTVLFLVPESFHVSLLRLEHQWKILVWLEQRMLNRNG